MSGLSYGSKALATVLFGALLLACRRRATGDIAAATSPAPATPEPYRLADLHTAGTIVDAFRAARGRPAAVLRLAVASRHQLTGLGRLLWRLPRRDVTVSGEAAGRDIDAFLHEDFRHRRCRTNTLMHPYEHLRNRVARRLAIGVLDIPARPEEYLVGTKRQRVRTSLRNARRLGVTCRELVDVDEQLGVVTYVLARRDDPWQASEAAAVASRVRDGRARTFAAFDAAGVPLAVTVVVCDRDWAYLRLSISLRGDASSEARYLVHAYVVERLSLSGARALISQSMLDVAPGLRSFQHLLGFRPCHLRLSAPAATRPHLGLQRPSRGITRLQHRALDGVPGPPAEPVSATCRLHRLPGRERR